jgi:hypothetical protein
MRKTWTITVAFHLMAAKTAQSGPYALRNQRLRKAATLTRQSQPSYLSIRATPPAALRTAL